MKGLYFTAALMCALSLNVSAAEISCQWIGGNEGKQGDSLVASISEQWVTISGHHWAGTYPRMIGEDVQGRDGKTYYSYNAGYNDGANHVLVDWRLLASGSSGLLKLRGRGEGFFERRYFCVGKISSRGLNE